MMSLVIIYQILIVYCFYVCGSEDKSKLRIEGKIVGGDYAKISNFPHAVFLSMICGPSSIICGSSVINQLILVTAAHCLQCKKSFRINAQAGDDNLKEVTVVRKAIMFKIHPKFSDKSLENDIALILLSDELPLGNNIKRVIIKTSYPAKPTTYVAGWGITDDVTRTRTFYLKKVQAPLYTRDHCSVVGHIYPGMICAGTFDNANRPSRGDSGSALITTNQQQLGLVSFRTESHLAMLVYTNVSYYYSWIHKTAKHLYCSKTNL